MSRNGFTLVEILVVIALVGIFGIMLVSIFINTLKGSNKSQMLAEIKQNGQAVLQIMGNAIRNADEVVCKSDTGDVLAVVREGKYTRFRFTPPKNTDINKGTCASPGAAANGCVFQDFPKKPDSGNKSDIYVFIAALCVDPPGTDSTTASILTDTNSQTGVSATGYFSKNLLAGYRDSITINLTLQPGLGVAEAIRGQIDNVEFKTTIGLR